MEQNIQDYYSLKDVSNHILSFIKYLRKKLWMLLLVLGLSILTAILLYYNQKPNYRAVTTFILEEKSTPGSGLAGLASQFGFDMGSLGGGSIFTGDNILDILRSKKIINEVLLTKLDSGRNSQTLADLFLDFKGWKKKAELKGVNFTNVQSLETLSLKQDSVLNEIHSYIVKHSLSADRVNKKGSIISVQVTSTNSFFARLITERMVRAAANLYLDIKTGTAQANISKLQRRSDSLLVLLNHKSYVAAANQPLDINPGVKSAVVPLEIVSRDKTVLATLYAEVTKNLEASKLILSQQTPVIQILDRPGQLLNDNKRSLTYMLIVTPVAGIVIYFILAFPFFLWSDRSKS
jgi:uncharacterized protein involved in exopolysaccharide biosynthesis